MPGLKVGAPAPAVLAPAREAEKGASARVGRLGGRLGFPTSTTSLVIAAGVVLLFAVALICLRFF